VSKFCDVDLHPDAVPNEEMGLIFENLIRRFNELANETAGDHFTPREVIPPHGEHPVHQRRPSPRDARHGPKAARSRLRHRGMLAESQNYLREHHSEARLYVYGQDYNKRAYATAASDMLMKQVDHKRRWPQHPLRRYLYRRPIRTRNRSITFLPTRLRLDWKSSRWRSSKSTTSAASPGDSARACRASTTAPLLFLQHMIDKFEPVLPISRKYGSRLAIVFQRSPLFTGGTGSGESDIRKWIIEND